MNTANILGSHLNPQQISLFTGSPSSRKRWIWSQNDDHLQLLAARAAKDAIAGQPVIIWYDEESAAEEIFRHYPFYQLEKAIYQHHGRPETFESALQIQPAEQGIHHIELYKLSADYERIS